MSMVLAGKTIRLSDKMVIFCGHIFSVEYAAANHTHSLGSVPFLLCPKCDSFVQLEAVEAKEWVRMVKETEGGKP